MHPVGFGIGGKASALVAVEKAIFSTGSRDAWELIRWGLPTDRDYLAQAVAAMLIVGNREILE